ncbi:MAG: hypothetical protein WC865_11270 [Bacteroidales bacterium]
MTKKRLSDDDFMEVYRELRAWKERDAARTLKYQRLIRLSKRKHRIQRAAVIVSGVAALFMIIVLVPWTGLRTHNSQENLYKQYYEAFRFASDYRDGSEVSNKLYQQAISAYRNQHWEEAEILADSLSALDPTNPDYLLLDGLSKQACGKYDEAIKQYLVLIPEGGSYAQNARWYLALNYLKQGKVKECRGQLDTLKKQSSSFHREKIDLLLEKMKSMINE